MGSGIERIHSALAESHCLDVEIHYNTMFILEFPRPTFTAERLAVETKTSEKTSEKILQLVKDNHNITIAELA